MYYRTKNDGGIMLYNIQNKILMRNHVNDRMNPSVTLTTDYYSCLTDSAYHGNLYYSYINTNHQIVVKITSSNDILYLMNCSYNCDNLPLKLTVFSNYLILFYCEEISDNTFNLCYTTPIGNRYKYRIPFEFDNSFKISILIGNVNSIIEFSDNRKNILYRILPDLSYEEINYTQSQNEIIHLKDVIRNNEIKHLNEINCLNEQIKSATSQYNELMKVANHYKNEAIKWRSKFDM
ncbi:MAG: hypothetical protein UH211_01600 [Agathobacter sp.]|nr:hypothetical protein [Agathobacter sp.]